MTTRTMEHRVDVVVLGAGAAGLMAAAACGRRGRRVALLEHGDRVGRKILISGGGRCNFTNLRTQAENFLSENPHFARSALARYTPQNFVQLVEKHAIPYHEKTLGQLFCDGSAQAIATLLERECGEAGVAVHRGVAITSVRTSAAPGAARFVVATQTADWHAASVIVATGGLSIPKLGATGFGYEVARVFGHRIIDPRPALVPLVFDAAAAAEWTDLAGVSCEVVATAAASRAVSGRRSQPAPRFREKLLITHRGLSGPAVLQISSYWRPGHKLQFDLVPDRAVLGPLEETHARRDAASMARVLRSVLPARLADRWCQLATQNGADWTNAGLARQEAALHAWTLVPAGTEGFAKAEVTAGGVDTHELDSRTMESRRVPGLFFAGEVMDVTGWLGGYNFQWAWASGMAAGLVA